MKLCSLSEGLRVSISRVNLWNSVMYAAKEPVWFRRRREDRAWKSAFAGSHALRIALRNLCYEGIPTKAKHGSSRDKEEILEHAVSIIASLLGGLTRGSRKERLIGKFTENEFEKIDRLMELYVRYMNRVKVETKRLETLDLDDVEMDEEDRYLARMDAGLYTLQLLALILSHAWASENQGIRDRIDLLLKQQRLSRKDVAQILQARLKKTKGKERLFSKLSMRYYGPFQVCDKISDVAYRLKLPESWRIHNAFHVSLLRPYVGDVPEDLPVEDQPEVEELDEILVPEQILAHKERKVKGKVARRYLVKFRNYPPMDAKWMEEGELAESPTVLSLYLEAFGLQPTLTP
ncbi:hypothetical protein L7F22_022536 [Adiantum nelumboides]|nr:hypothetical protein [Adiantum nelumboides]